ncbi:MAG: DUF3592 domain-containing protein [Candidatus Melainabacteria bacterium]|nr:DUF3592 domain-containing protein [Candidatus Melainabacteria bacterium]
MTNLETLEQQTDKNRLKERLRVPFLVFLVVIVIAVFCTMDLQPFMKTVATGSWSEAPGITKRSGLSRVDIGKDPAWRNVVVYKYTVDGKDYVNDVIAFQLLTGLPGYEANMAKNRYSPGSTVTVFYDPKNPQDSCIDPNRRWDIISMHLILYVLLAALAYLSCYPPYKPDESGFST